MKNALFVLAFVASSLSASFVAVADVHTVRYEKDYFLAVLDSEALASELAELSGHDADIESVSITGVQRCPGCYRFEVAIGNSEEQYIAKLGTRLDLESDKILVGGEDKKARKSKKDDSQKTYVRAVLASELVTDDSVSYEGKNLRLQSIVLTKTLRCPGCFQYDVTYATGPELTEKEVEVYQTRRERDNSIVVTRPS